jgi:hypothetical protein
MGTFHVKNWHVKIFAIAAALCGSLISAPVEAKTFVGVLWPMFGPLPAIGLVELVAELKMMPDVEVETYVHQAWPSLVDDLARQPPGTHTVVVGYSLGANSSVFVANNAKHVDLIVALQPSLLSWNPPLEPGKVGRMIEIYNPNPWMTLGGMGSRKLVGDNIEYITNNDSHPGAQFSPQFRDLVKSEVANFAAEDRVETAQAATPGPLAFAQPDRPAPLQAADARPAPRHSGIAAEDHRQIAQGEILDLPQPAEPQPVAQEPLPAVPEPEVQEAIAAAPEPAAQEPQQSEPKEWTAFLDGLSNSVNSGDVSAARQLTLADMMDYASKTYRVARKGDRFGGRPASPAGGEVIAASFARDGSL